MRVSCQRSAVPIGPRPETSILPSRLWQSAWAERAWPAQPPLRLAVCAPWHAARSHAEPVCAKVLPFSSQFSSQLDVWASLSGLLSSAWRPGYDLPPCAHHSSSCRPAARPSVWPSDVLSSLAQEDAPYLDSNR